MKYEKGKEKTGGRAKGTPNKSNAKIREAFQLLIEGNLDKMEDWIAAIAKKDPKGAMDLIVKLSEFYLPKLSRTEVKGEIEQKVKLGYHKDFSEGLEALKRNVPFKDIGTPSDISNILLFLASEKAKYITGVSIPVDGGSYLI